MAYEWDFAVVFRDFHLLWQGLLNTLRITVVSLGLGLPIGLVAAVMRLARPRWLRLAAGAFIEVFRSTPPLVQLFWFFFVLPILVGIRLGPYEAAVITFSLQSSSFFAEVFRGGIVSIERGQWEAGRALGLTYRDIMRYVVLPQAVKRMIPAFLERIIELMKTTSLAAAIAYGDLLYQAMNISQSTYRPLEVFTTAAFMYFAILFAASLGTRWIERRLAVSGE